MRDARGGFRGAAAPGRAARRRAADGARAGLGVGLGRARGGAADPAGVRRGAALPALRRRAAAALGPRQRAAPLSVPSLPQDLRRADRHLPGAAAQEGLLAALRRGARGGHEPGRGGRPLRRAPHDQLPLAAPLPAREALGGVVEADETFVRRSHKGSRRWRRGDAPPGRGPRRRGERAGKRGLSAEQVPALIARDRAGHTADAVLPGLGADAITAALGPVVAGDAVLCSDGAKAYATFAAERGLHHEPVNLAAGVRVREGAFHIQNVNAYHGRLKGWMGRFNGVATRYLPNYLGWRRTLERAPEPSASKTWLLAAVRPIPTANAN